MDINIDGFRFIKNTHTIVRALPICSAISRTLSTKELPKSFLREILGNWSSKLEDMSQVYNEHNGKLTINHKPTTAFKHYLEFQKNLGLINSLGEVFANSRMGILLYTFSKENHETYFGLNNKELIFYTKLLLELDADAILLSLDIIALVDNGVTQIDILKKYFKSKLLERLLLKKEMALGEAQSAIREKFISVEYQWENAESYAEHIIIPRLEWLSDIGIIHISKTNNKSFYCFTKSGFEFYSKIPEIGNSGIKDINAEWLQNKYIESILCLLPSLNYIKFSDLDNNDIERVLEPHLEQVFLMLSSKGSYTVSLYPAILFITINLLVQNNLIVEENELIELLLSSINIGNRQYNLNQTQRINESYISLTII